LIYITSMVYQYHYPHPPHAHNHYLPIDLSIYPPTGSDKKNPVKYEEGRELDDFLKYLSTHTSSAAIAAHAEL